MAPKTSTKAARHLKEGDHLVLRNRGTAEVLHIEPAVNQYDRPCLILTLYRAGKMVVKPYRLMTVRLPEPAGANG